MKVAILVGSLRRDSFNMQLALTVQERYKDKFQADIVPIGHLPFFNQDMESDPPADVVAFKEQIKQSDAVILVTPEYNWSVSAVLKNALEWASRGEKVFVGKPVLPMGVSAGVLGTVRAQLHLREMLASPGLSAKMMPPGGNEILVGTAPEKFDPERRRLVHEPTLAFLDTVMDKFVAFVAANTGQPAAV